MAPSTRKDRNFSRKKRRTADQRYLPQSYYRGNGRRKFETTYAKRSPTKVGRSRKPLHRFYEAPYLRASSESSETLDHPMGPGTRGLKNRMHVIDATSSLDRPSSANSSVSTPFTEAASAVNSVNCTMALLKKKSLVQIINNYIRAGIEEGKRRAKQYIRRALSFGVKSGYLIPADQQGQVLHVSPALVNGKKPRDREKEKARESRKRRQKARRGEDESDIVDRKALRRGPPPLAVKSKKLHDTANHSVVPAKRRRQEPKARKTNSTVREGHGKGSLDTALSEPTVKSKRGRQIKRKKLAYNISPSIDRRTEKSSTSRIRRRGGRKSRSPARKSIERNRSVSSLNENREERLSEGREGPGTSDEKRAALGFAKDRSKLPRTQHDVPRAMNEENNSQDDEEDVNCATEMNDQEMWSGVNVDPDREACDQI